MGGRAGGWWRVSSGVKSRFTVPLSRGDLDAERVGGKACSLGRLSNNGFRVPPGFCITVDAFEHVVAGCVDEVETLAELRAEIREARLPDELVDDVRSWTAEIGARRWAVRSSAVEEDAETISFAGQQRTELNLEEPSNILGAVRRVWADLYNLDSLLYRARLRVDAVPRPMAVLVQAMVDPVVGGVMFTKNPLENVASDESEGDREMLITASDDSGLAVVEGRGGESFLVDRNSGEVRRSIGGGHMGGMENFEEHGEVLGNSQMSRLVDLGRGIEEMFGAARDIEWVIGRPAGSKPVGKPELYVLQARPITDKRDRGLVDGEVWSNVNVGEALPGVATPLTWSIIGKFSRRGFERAFGTLGLSVPEDYELVGSFRGRVYLNLTQFVSIASGIPIFEPEILFQMGGGGGVDLVRDAARERSPWEFLRHLPATILRVIGSQVSMPVIAPLWSQYFRRRLDEFFDRDLVGENRSGLVEQLDDVDWLFDRNGLIMLTCSSNFLMSYVVMKKVLEWFGGETIRERERTLFGALGVQSAEPALELLELTRLARGDETVESIIRETPSGEVRDELRRRADRGETAAREFLDAVDGFIDEHGHRAPREAELSTPRWREEAAFVFEMMAHYLEHDEVSNIEEYQDRWGEVHEEVDQLVEQGFGPVFGAMFGLLLEWARSTARIREYMRSHVVESLDMYRRFAMECGRRLEQAGELRCVEDVFYLRHDELRRWLDNSGAGGDLSDVNLSLRAMVRRDLVEALREIPPPPDTFVVRDGDLVDARKVRAGGESAVPRPGDVREVLEGLSGSPGTTTGRARVIEDPDKADPIQSGEILVAPYTDVGWSPLFVTASGIVMGLGGPLSHACIVAREFGIPTVVNARDASDVIRTGDRVTVDGDAGIVYVHEERSDDASAV
jgi:pyruvate,water dikinase